LTTGCRPKTQEIVGKDAPNVFTINDFKELLNMQSVLNGLEGKKHIVICGAGFVGNETACALKGA